jgi:hypothetical protein
MTPLTTLAQALKDDIRVNEICKAVWLVLGEDDGQPCLVLNCSEQPLDTIGAEPTETLATLLVQCFARGYELAYDIRTRVIAALHRRNFPAVGDAPGLDSVRFLNQQAAIVPVFSTGQAAGIGIPITFECIVRRA